MKAIRAATSGPPEVLRLIDLPDPRPGPGQILVRVAVAGVNFADTMLRRNAYFVPVSFPLVPGVEVAGHVEAVGAGVTGWKPGDRIAGIRLDSGGGYAELALLEAGLAAPVPSVLDLEIATAVLNQGLTAQGLIETALEIRSGGTVLVTAAGGGVGGLLVQLAWLAGADLVIAAAGSAGKLPDGVNYAEAGWQDMVRSRTGRSGVKVVFDAIGGTVRADAIRLLAPGGRLVFYGAASGSSGIDDAALTQLLARSASLTGYAIHNSIRADPAWLPRTLERLFDQAVSGALRTPIHPPYRLIDAGLAHAAVEARTTRGKVLLTIGDA